MRNLLLCFLFAIVGAFAQVPTVTITGTDNLSHSVVRLTFNVNKGYVNVRTRYVAGGSCTSGTGGTVQQMLPATYFTNGMRVVVGGLLPSTTYQICPEVTTNGTNWSSGVGTTITTLPLPGVHPAPPIPPATFNTSYPNTSGYSSVTVATDCHDFQNDFNSAINAQLSHGTVINIPAGTVCSAGAPYQAGVMSPDNISFSSGSVSTANSSITLPNHGLSEGQTVVFSQVYGAFPASSSCLDGTGFAEQGIIEGQLYPVHVLDTNTIQVYCDKPPAQGGTQMIFTNQGSGGLLVRPEPNPLLKWVIVRTATPDVQFAPEHTRVTPAWVPKMASFVQPFKLFGNGSPQNMLFNLGNADAGSQYAVSNIRFTGIEFTTADDSPDTGTSTDPNFWWRTLIVNPWNQNVIFDRCYVHGRGTPSRVSNGFYWDGHNMAVVDSYFEHLEYFHPTYTGLTASKISNTTFTIAPGTHHMGVTTATLASTVTVNISGSSSGASFTYFDLNGNLKTSLPPGITGACTGGPCEVFTANNAPGNGVYVAGNGGVFPSQTYQSSGYWSDAAFSRDAGCGSTTTIYPNSLTPSSPFKAIGGVEVGTQFISDVNGYVCGVRFYKDPADTGTHTGTLWKADGTQLATTTFSSESASGWQQQSFSGPVAVTAGAVYVISHHSTTGTFSQSYFHQNVQLDNPPLHALASYSGNIGSCNTSSDWPRNGYGNPAAGEITCTVITNGTITGGAQADATTSTHVTEGSNFMIGGNGPGPYEVLDTYIEGVGLTFHHDFSGGDTRTMGDYTYNRDTFMLLMKHMHESTSSDGYRYFARQPLEWKEGARIAITGSIFDGQNSEDTPSPSFIEFASDGGPGTHDVLLQNNTFQHGAGGFFSPGIIPGGLPQGPPPVRVAYRNNLFWDIDGNKYHDPCCQLAGAGWILGDGGMGTEDLVFDHNTVIQNVGRAPSIWHSQDTVHEGVQITNNFLYLTGGDWGFAIEDYPQCTSNAGKLTADCIFTPGYRFDHNVLLSDSSRADVQAAWPNTLLNYIPSDPTKLTAVGWVNFDASPIPYVNGNPKNYDFRLKSNASNYCSRCGNPASDGSMVGADMNALEAAQGKVTAVTVPPSSITSSTATIAFLAPDSQGCSVDYGSTDPMLITSFTRVADTGGPRLRNIQLTGLTSGTTYHYRVNCAVQQPTGQFRTN